MTELRYSQVREMLLSCTERILRNEPYLTLVDSAIDDKALSVALREINEGKLVFAEAGE